MIFSVSWNLPWFGGKVEYVVIRVLQYVVYACLDFSDNGIKIRAKT